MKAPPRWLLDVYSLVSDDVKMLVASQDHIEFAYNLRLPQGYLPKEVIAGVKDWWEAGLLEINDNPLEVNQDLDKVSAFPIQYDPRFLADIDRHPSQRFYIGLTALGGAEWERIAQPNWNEYVNDMGEFDTEKDVEIRVLEAISRSRVEHMIETLKSVGVELEWESGKWLELHPWEPRYWKTLPYGVRFEIEGKLDDPRFWNCLAYWNERDGYWLARPYDG